MKTSKTRHVVNSSALPNVNLSEHDGVRSLHLDSPWIQGSMRITKPLDLELEYVQRMMTGLLFLQAEQIQHSHAMQLGLGAASLTKFCYKRLGMRTTAIEINPQVAAACMRWFRLPENNEQLQVLIANASDAVQDIDFSANVDLLHVDLYDHEAAGPVLEDASFYQHCFELLTDHGSMCVNLFGRHMSFTRNMRNIAQSFEPKCIWQFKPTREGNTVIVARKSLPTDETPTLLRQRAEYIEQKWKLPARQWVNALHVWQD